MAESLLIIGAEADAAKGLAQLVAARALDEFKLASGFKDQLRKLNKKFEYIQAFLEDAANSKYAQKSKLVKLWVQKVKDVAYLADDVMDEYAIEMFRREMEVKNRSSRKIREFFTHSNPVAFRLQMAHKVNEILALFDEIDKEAKDIGLNPVDFTTNTSVTATSNEDHNLSQIRDYAAASPAEFVGRVKDETELLDFICSPLTEKHHLSTVAVVGMGGVGKTTFARHLYDHERICAHFGVKKIWVTVKENFEINRLLNMMLESVTSSNLELSSIDAIRTRLQEKLKGDKLFIVFDDVWNENENLWGSLKALLLTIGIGPGSVILTTTRSDDVATAAGAVFKHKLEGLSEHESWSLFDLIVSTQNMQPISSSMEKVGRRIVHKCRGVPLAIKVIGGLLRSKPNLHEWEKIERSQLWDLPNGHDQILPSLLLSFNHLSSSSIKQCFAYLAIIPRGIKVLKSELLGLWLAQGYLRYDKRKKLTLEEIGEEYLKILLSNSLLECVPASYGFVGYETHDLVYDLAVYVCGSDVIKEAKDLCEEGTCRHLNINLEGNTSTLEFPPEKALTKLRTLDIKGTTVPWTMLMHTKYLRTLLIDRTGITEVSPDIASLKHLRFLDASYNPITTLPDSISKLYQLQTLILQCCTNMKKLPKALNKLPNLRHISTTAPMFAWKGLQRLTNLQSLPSLSLNDDSEGWTIDELGYLHELRGEVHILGLECVKDKENARKAGFAQKANVTKLKLSWVEGRRSEGICDEDVLEGLEPHSNITSLEVLNFLGLRFPEWIMKMGVLTDRPSSNKAQLDNLHTVKLLNCSRCETLPKLGQLPLLKFLTLSGFDVEIIGSKFYGSDDVGMPEVVSFKSLRELEISKFRRLTTWREPPKAAFPSLETLRVKYCSALESVPAFEFRSLTTLELEYLISVESLDIIKFSSGLISLTMDGLPKIESLPRELANCTKLQTLSIYNFGKLASLPIGLEALVNLQSLKVYHCAVLNFIMNDILYIRSSLRSLEINNCPSLKTIPSSLEECIMLSTLMVMKCPMIKDPLTNMSKLQRLSELRMSFRSAKQLRSVLESAKDLPLLSRLEIEGFRNEKEMKDYFSDMTPFLNLPSLTELMLNGYPNIKTLPKQLGLLTRITALYIWQFDDLEESPSWICNFTSLRCLIFENCNNLKGLPNKERMKSLTYLRIVNCPLLVERYAKDGGSEWENISHIREIIMDDKTIQLL